MKKIIRLTTISGSLNGLLKGQLRYLNMYFQVIGVASGLDGLRELEKQEGIKTYEVKMSREISLVQDFKSLFTLIKYISKTKPYIVHANTPKASLLSMIAAWICRVPHRIYTVTGLRFETTSGWFRKLLICMEKITCACATKVIPEGEGVKKTLLREKITSKPLQVILNGNINGIDTNYFTATAVVQSKTNIREKLGFDKNDFVFVFVGRMVKDKGINELVSAFSQLYKENPRGKLLLVGPFEKELDPLFPETEQAILNHEGIKFVGFQKDVRPFFKAADALVFPSYREGFPNVVMQAGAMGLPSIVTDINGCNEIIIEGKNGAIIPSRDRKALLEQMNYFMTNPTAVEEMAQQSRNLISSRFEQSKVWKATLEMYQSLEKE